MREVWFLGLVIVIGLIVSLGFGGDIPVGWKILSGICMGVGLYILYYVTVEGIR